MSGETEMDSINNMSPTVEQIRGKGDTNENSCLGKSVLISVSTLFGVCVLTIVVFVIFMFFRKIPKCNVLLCRQSEFDISNPNLTHVSSVSETCSHVNDVTDT